MSLQPDDLDLGDVLLKRSHGGFTHWFIRRVTANEGPASNYVHAAVYVGHGTIAESTSSGRGYVLTDLMNQGVNFHYRVGRYTADPELAAIAAHIASTWARMRVGDVPAYAGGRNFGGYGLAQALGAGFDNRLNRNIAAREGEGESFWGSDGQPGVSSSFCSQFAVQAYNAAGATCSPPVVPIPLAANRATPAMLYNEFERLPGWTILAEPVVTR